MPLAQPDPETLSRHVAFVRSVARAALAGDAAFEDVAQETWVAALHGAPDDPRSLKAWLGTVTRRQAALRLRRRSRERRRIERLAHVGPPRRQESAADSLARAEVGQRLVDAMLTLPEMYRSVLLLRYHDDLPPREIAKRLGVPVETVRTRARRGLVQLRDRMEAAERRRGGNWRASLLGLLPRQTVGVSASVGTSVGVMLMKKSIGVAAVLSLLIGGAVLWWQPWSEEESVSLSNRIHADAPESAWMGDPQATPPLALRGDAKQEIAGRSAFPNPVDLSAVDRERDLHGIVRDGASGEPVSGAEIELIEKTWARSAAFDSARFAERLTRGATRSAIDGTFRIRLEPGDAVDLHVRAPGYARHRVRGAQAGERLDLSLRLGTKLRIRVISPSGEVLAGARLRVFQSSNATTDGHGFTTQDGVTTDEGVHVFGGLPPGLEVMVDASHPVHGSAMWREARAPDRGTTDMEITIPPGRTLAGRVTDARSGAPIVGARVGVGWTLDAAVTTDAQGAYELPGWTAQGVYEVAVRAKGYAQDESVVGSRTRIDFALATEFRIRGRVVGSTGRPVPGALVSAVGSSWDTSRQITSSGTTVADDQGRFDVGGLRRDMPHRLILVARGFGRTLYDLPAPAKREDTRDVGSVRMASAGAIAGVVQRPDGTPLRRIAVVLEGSNADREILLGGASALDHDYGMEEERYTDDLGRFRFRDVAPGTYTATARLPGGSTVGQEVVRKDGPSTTRIALIVNQGRRFTVRVQDTAGQPVDQAIVFVATGDGERLRGKTDLSGRADFEVLRRPTHVDVDTVFDLSRKRYIDPQDVAVPDGNDEILVRLVEAAWISGRVLDEQDKPLARVTLRALRDDVEVADTWTRKDGTFRVLVPLGAQVDLELQGTRMESMGLGFVTKEAFLSGRIAGVRAGDDDVVLRAHAEVRNATLTVKVTDPSGRALAGARIYVNRPKGSAVTDVRTGPSGDIVIRDLPSRELRFQAARAPGAHKDWVIPARVLAVPDGQTLTLAYREGASIQGVLVDDEGDPVAGARVAAEYSGGAYHTNTDDQGRFEARVPAAEAEITVYVMPPGAPDSRAGAVRARPGDTDIRLVRR